MITQFPLDIMHLVDLGVVKKILVLLFQGKTKERLSANSKYAMSSMLTSFSPFIPREFARKPRSFAEISRWKAVEFRQFILYTGLIVVEEFLSQELFKHFLLLTSAYRIFLSPNLSTEKINIAHDLLKKFFEQFSDIFGKTSLTYNVHNLLHLRETAQQFGCLSNLTAYPFKNMMKSIKKAVKKPQKIEEQLYNTFIDLPLIKIPKTKGLKRNSEGKIKSFASEIGLFTRNCPDSYCLIDDEFFAQITDFNGNDSFQAKVFINSKDIFLEPIKSKELGICIANTETFIEKSFKLDQISAKLVSLPYKNDLLLITLVHNQDF